MIVLDARNGGVASRAMLEISNSVRKFMTGDQHTITQEEHDAWIAACGTDRIPLVFFDEYGEPLGNGTISIERSDRIYAWTTHSVVESKRGKGYGKVILGHLVERARLLGCDAMRADILRDNQASLGLCKSLGYYVSDDSKDKMVEVTLDL